MPPAEPRSVSNDAPPEPPQTVLLVDDETDITTALQDTIEAYLDGVVVLVANSGPEALALMDKHAIDLIITDYKMPGMNGIEFLRKAREKAPAVPRIMITAFPDMDLVIRAINEEHLLNFIPKPLKRDNVLNVITAALAQRKAETMNRKYVAAALEALRRGET